VNGCPIFGTLVSSIAQYTLRLWRYHILRAVRSNPVPKQWARLYLVQELLFSLAYPRGLKRFTHTAVCCGPIYANVQRMAPATQSFSSRVIIRVKFMTSLMQTILRFFSCGLNFSCSSIKLSPIQRKHALIPLFKGIPISKWEILHLFERGTTMCTNSFFSTEWLSSTTSTI